MKHVTYIRETECEWRNLMERAE